MYFVKKNYFYIENMPCRSMSPILLFRGQSGLAPDSSKPCYGGLPATMKICLRKKTMSIRKKRFLSGREIFGGRRRDSL